MTFIATAGTPMARNRSTTPLYEPTQASKALKMRRVELGKSQADVAFDSDLLTQTTVSELERGKYGPSDLTAGRLSALARGLNWSVAELEAAAGLNLNLSTVIIDDAVGRPRRGPPVAPRLPAIELPLEVPPALQEAIDKFGDEMPEMRIEANVRAVTSLHRYGGTNDLTPLQWLEVFSANRRWLVKPDGD